MRTPSPSRAAIGLFTCLLATSLALLSPACTVRGGTTPERDAGPSSGTDTGTADVPYVWPDVGPVTDCAAEARWIYAIDSDGYLLRYEPDSNTLTRVGMISCSGPATTPFSMAVDRNAMAHVLHSDHRIYTVDTRDASCTPSPFVPDQMGLELFGMGFVTDAADTSTETLYIAGNSASALMLGASATTLAHMTTADWTLAAVGPIEGAPELTGNANGELWGFFPQTTPMSVRQIDRTNGAVLQEFDVSAVGGTASAWAFAFWGGRYYMFFKGAFQASTNIWRLDPATGAVESVYPNTGYRIVGAGVSTCAPVILF